MVTWKVCSRIGRKKTIQFGMSSVNTQKKMTIGAWSIIMKIWVIVSMLHAGLADSSWKKRNRMKEDVFEETARLVKMLHHWRDHVDTACPLDSDGMHSKFKTAFRVEEILESLRLSKLLKSEARDLPKVIERSLSLGIPEPYRDTSMSLYRASKKPSRSTIRYHEFTIDLSLILLQRKRRSTDSIKYDWSDSSPQADFDWMWTEFREIDAEMIVELFEAVTALELLTTITWKV